MSHELPFEKTELTHSERLLLDEAVERFEAAWKAWQSGPPPRLGDFAEGASGRLRTQLVSDLIKLDCEYRSRHAMPRELAEYRQENPDLKDFSTSLNTVPRAQPNLPATTPQPAGFESPRSGAGQRVGGYRIVKRLGGGGQAEAFQAIDEVLGHEVVIKLSHYALDGKALERDRLATEGQVLAKLNHPAIAKVYAAGVDSDYPFLVMELVHGQTLEQHARGARLGPRQAARLVAQVARGVDLANRHGVVHQDINPRNVLVDVSGQPKLIDFGLAYIHSAWQEPVAQIGGTVLYMSPEQAQGNQDSIDCRTDVFALGALLYYVLTGKPPFAGATREQAMIKAASCEFDAKALDERGVPRRLQSICLRAMSAEPKNRPASAGELADELDWLLGRRRFLQIGAALAAAAVALPAGWWMLSPRAAVDPQLAIRVRRGETYLPLLDALPIATGDRLQVRFSIPAGMGAALYTVDAAGHPEEVERWPTESTEREVTFPSAEQDVEITGPTGTELIVLCLDPSPELQIDELATSAAASDAVEQLPDWIVVEAKDSKIVAVEQPLLPGQSRGFGPRHAASDPVEATKSRLKQLQTTLQPRCRAWSAVAFGHGD